MPDNSFIPYPPIEKLGLIGDRRTAALVSCDGTISWMGLPNYDGSTIFGALLDAANGGYWKIGPRARRFGRQCYPFSGPILQTSWVETDGSLDLLDFMPWAEDRRNPTDAARRVVIRRLRCTRGRAVCRTVLQPRNRFASSLRVTRITRHKAVFDAPQPLCFWCSKPLDVVGNRIQGELELCADEEIWCSFGPGEDKFEWSASIAAEALHSTIDYWDRWIARIGFRGSRRAGILRSAMLVHALTFAPTGALVASPTTSLPERIGADRNYDYRYAWVRDAALALGFLARLGLTHDANRFLDWLAGLQSRAGRPLQVLYSIDGRRVAPPVEQPGIDGYRQSRPVRFGNAAVSMVEIDSYGYLADCALTYLKHGGNWRPEHWTMIRRIADYTTTHWHMPGSSIWELLPRRQFVASKVMSAVTLERALTIASLTGRHGSFVSRWTAARARIFEELMTRGWSESLGSLRQHYDADTLDAAALLIPIMNVLPCDHPRVTGTISAISRHLEINGFIHRFVAAEFSGGEGRPFGEEEGGFLICSFWLAQVLAQTGDVNRADAILRRAEEVAGEPLLFAEGIDARNGSFLGNMPLAFAQVEYASAALALDEARRRSRWAPVGGQDRRPQAGQLDEGSSSS